VKIATTIARFVDELHKLYSNSLHDEDILISYEGSADGIPFKRNSKFFKGLGGQLDTNIVCGIEYGITNNEVCRPFKLLIDDNPEDKNLALAYLRAYVTKSTIENYNAFLKNHKSRVKAYSYQEVSGKNRSVTTKIILPFRKN